MSTLELKSDLHRILEGIEDEHLLRTVYEFLKQGKDSGSGKIWESLTVDQRKEVYASYEESKSDNNLISWEQIKKKY